TPFPYTTLFRSRAAEPVEQAGWSHRLGRHGMAGRLLAPVPHIHGGPAAAYGRVRDAGQVGRSRIHPARPARAWRLGLFPGPVAGAHPVVQDGPALRRPGGGLPDRVFPRRASAMGVGQVVGAGVEAWTLASTCRDWP